MKSTPFTDALFTNIAKWTIGAIAAIALLQNTSPIPANLPGDPNINEHQTSLSESDENQPGWDCRTMGNHMCGQIDPLTGEWITVEWFTI